MNKKIFLIFLGMFLFNFAFVSAESLGTFKQGDTFNLTNYCQEGGCTGITLTTITYPNGSTNYINEAMVFLNQQGFYEFNDSGTLGVYSYCTLGSNSVTNCAEFKITPNGENLEYKDLISRFALILFFGVLIFFIYSSSKSTNYEKWYNKLKNNYENRNYVKLGLGSIAYQLIKNQWVIFYTIGFLIVTLLMDVVYIFNIESIFQTMQVLTFIYSWSFILVGIVFLSYLQEFFKMLLEQIENEAWGLDK